MKTSDYLYIAVSTALIIICSWITIPTAVPFTLQLFGIFLTLGLLGGKKGTLAVLLYILLGAVGIPVFSGFQGGVGVIAGPLGGFILGFIILSLTVYFFETVTLFKFKNKPIIAMIIGLLLCYICGIIQFISFYRSSENPISISFAISSFVLPFIIPDILKLYLAVKLCKRVKPHLKS